MRRVVACLSAVALAAGCAGLAIADPSGKGLPLWDFYSATLRHAKYIDLTHAIAPGGPIGEGFVDFTVGPTLAGVAIPGFIDQGEPFSYEKHGGPTPASAFPS